MAVGRQILSESERKVVVIVVVDLVDRTAVKSLPGLGVLQSTWIV